MAEKGISYLNRNFDDYKKSLMNITQQYYSEILPYLNDASIGTWFIELFADIADNLSYHIDRVYQETSLNAANERSSLLDIARNMGVKIPTPRAAVVEIELSCELPINAQSGASGKSNLAVADESYAPYIKRGTLFSDGLHSFELVEDCDFLEQFDENGFSNRTIEPVRDSNGNIVRYKYTKLAIASAGSTKVFKRVLNGTDIKPFMEILLQDQNIMGVESIIMMDGTNISDNPYTVDFLVDSENYKSRDGKDVTRFFEVDSLVEQYRFGDVLERSVDGNYNTKWETEVSQNFLDVDGNHVTYDEPVQVRRIAKGQWKPLKHKFITETTDNGSLKIIFGSGLENVYGDIPTEASEFTQYIMSRMEANDYMGVLPKANHTIYVLYKVGGGIQTNITKNTLTNIINLNATIDGNCEDPADAKKKKDVLASLRVTNTTPSYGGKDAPSNDELKYLIKYHTAAQNRCVTLKDYEARIMEMPYKYGLPFRCAAVEENNKIIIYTLGLNPDGTLASPLSEYVARNIKEYLTNYKMLNDLVEIHSGSVINIGLEIDVFVEKTYDKSEVVKRIIDTTKDYMDVRKHFLGEDIFLGDLEKEISKLDGVSNLIELRCYDKVGEEGYSSEGITQPYVTYSACNTNETTATLSSNINQIDLKESDKVLISEAHSMFEIKNNKDIKVNVKIR